MPDVTPLPKSPPRGPKARKRLKPMSDKRRRDLAEREKVVATVLARDRTCQARALVPEVRCASPIRDRAPLEVHEIVKRARWSRAWLTPEVCVALCQAHHDWTEAEPALATERGLLASAPPPGISRATPS